jgi:hypothetical protein
MSALMASHWRLLKSSGVPLPILTLVSRPSSGWAPRQRGPGGTASSLLKAGAESENAAAGPAGGGARPPGIRFRMEPCACADAPIDTAVMGAAY